MEVTARVSSRTTVSLTEEKKEVNAPEKPADCRLSLIHDPFVVEITVKIRKATISDCLMRQQSV